MPTDRYLVMAILSRRYLLASRDVATSSFCLNAGIYAEPRLPESPVGFAEITSQRPAADDLKISPRFDLADNTGTESNAGPRATAKGQYDGGVRIGLSSLQTRSFGISAMVQADKSASLRQDAGYSGEDE